MPKRKGFLLEKMQDRRFLKETIYRACDKKEDRPDVQLVLSDVEYATEELYGIVLKPEKYEPRKYKKVPIFDRSSMKHRDIKMAKFEPDCLVQWALDSILQPIIRARMDPYCSSSVKGRGGKHIFKGLKKTLSRHSRAAKYALVMDIHHYYDSISITKLMELFSRVIKDKRFLGLLEKVLRSSSEDGEHGIGIGYMICQPCANFFLEGVDRIIRNDPCVTFYCRNMDNMTVLGRNKRKLRKLLEKVKAALALLGLELNPDYQIFPTESRPIQAVGFRYYKGGTTTLRKRNWKRFRVRLLRALRLIREGEPIPLSLWQSISSRQGTQDKFAPSRKIDALFYEVRREWRRRKAA